MKLHAGIRFNNDGIGSTISSMVTTQETIGIIKDNVAGAYAVGYQRKVPVLSSFAEYIGPYALSENKDEQVGRIRLTKKPLDLALASQGYFQVQTENGTKLTRDGRFKLDKDGNLLSMENQHVLSKDGTPIKLEKVPKSLDYIKIREDGLVQYKDPDNLKLCSAGQISVVGVDGERFDDANMKQGYVELSNVSMQEEVYNMLPLTRAFSANRELFKIQSEALSRTLQDLGKA